MNTVISKLATAAAVNNSFDEINLLIERAKQSITPYNVAARMVYHALATEPTILGSYKMEASDQQQRNEGVMGEGRVYVDVRWYDAFMVIAFNMVASHEYLELSDLVNIVDKWNESDKNCSVRLDEDTIKKMSRAAITAMIRDGWVSKAVDRELAYIGEDGKERTRKARVFPATGAFIALYAETLEDMKASVPMKCAPLRFQPEPWSFDSDGRVVGIHPHANLKCVKGKSYPSQRTLDALNKAMATPLQAHPAMVMLAGFALSNQQVFKELDDQTPEKWEGTLRTWEAMRKLQTSVNYYFIVGLDSRGREYYRGGVISPQGGNHCKACFIDASKPELGKSGYYALLLGFAGATGIKGSIKARIRAVSQMAQSGEMLSLVKDLHPIEFLKRYKGEDKYQAYVIAHEIINALEWSKHNSIETYRCGVIIHQDGKCNGMQHMGIITRDRVTCESVNIMAATHDDELNDAYQLVSDNSKLLSVFGRDLVKNAVMVAGYGASAKTLHKSVREGLKKLSVDYTDAHGVDVEHSIESTLPAIASVTTAVKIACNDILASGETEIVMYAKDGFRQVQQYKYNAAAALPLGSFATVKHTEESDVLNCEQMITATPPNMIHMNDGCHARLVRLACDWALVTVHDSYGTAPANYFKTNVILAGQLAENYTDYCPVRNLYEDYGLPFAGFYSFNPVTLDEVRQAVNAFS